jgi:hypothetical protein
MRHVLILLVALMIGVLVATTPANKAAAGPLPAAIAAGPLPAAIAADLAPAMVEKVDYWHRYYRHHGYAPGAVVVVPAPVPDAPPPAVEVAPILVPVRPLSCGQYCPPVILPIAFKHSSSRPLTTLATLGNG